MDESALLAFDSYKTYSEIALKAAGKAYSLDDKVAYEWVWKLATDKNLLVFGLGDKFTLLHKFAKDYLKGEDMIEVNGNPKPKHNFAAYNLQSFAWMKSIHTILETISQSILKQEECVIAVHSPEGLIQACRHMAGRLISSKLYKLTFDQFPYILYFDLHFVNIEALDIHYGKNQDEDDENSTEPHLSEDEQTNSVATGDINLNEEEGGNEDNMNHSALLDKSKSHNGGRYAYNQARLYLVIHSICGPLFCHADAQICLSILAGCKCVSILASIDMLNVSLFWDGLSRVRYAWSWYHMPTYISSVLPEDHPCLIGAEGARESSANNRSNEQYSRDREETMSILSGFPTSHKEFLQILCKYCLDKMSRLEKGKPKVAILKESQKKKVRSTSSKSTISGKHGLENLASSDYACVPIDEVLKQGTAKLILKSKQDITEICKNFFDHQMLQDVRSSQFGDFLKVLLPPYLMEEVVKMKFT
ncbi:hypothetical protein EON65_51855 [archaeon]|nr:MAG: hypothetical protein EON65_51855 [archaeon]